MEIAISALTASETQALTPYQIRGVLNYLSAEIKNEGGACADVLWLSYSPLYQKLHPEDSPALEKIGYLSLCRLHKISWPWLPPVPASVHSTILDVQTGPVPQIRVG